MLEQTGLMDHHKNEKGEKAASRVENLEELLGAMQQFEPDEDVESDGQRLALFLDRASLDAGDAQADESFRALLGHVLAYLLRKRLVLWVDFPGFCG